MYWSPLTRTQAAVHANVWFIKKTSDGSKILAMVYFCNSIATLCNTALENKSTTDLHALQPESLLGVLVCGSKST